MNVKFRHTKGKGPTLLMRFAKSSGERPTSMIVRRSRGCDGFCIAIPQLVPEKIPVHLDLWIKATGESTEHGA